MKKNSPWHWIILLALLIWSCAVYVQNGGFTLGLDFAGRHEFHSAG